VAASRVIGKNPDREEGTPVQPAISTPERRELPLGKPVVRIVARRDSKNWESWGQEVHAL
jgi:hypothetical protein